MLFSALPAAVQASSAALRALESEIDLAASLHFEIASLLLELPQPAATSPQATSTSTDPLTRLIPSLLPVVVGASLPAGGGAIQSGRRGGRALAASARIRDRQPPLGRGLAGDRRAQVGRRRAVGQIQRRPQRVEHEDVAMGRIVVRWAGAAVGQLVEVVGALLGAGGDLRRRGRDPEQAPVHEGPAGFTSRILVLE